MSNAELKGVPILRIAGVSKAKQLYGDSLGLTVEWEHFYEEGAPDYM